MVSSPENRHPQTTIRLNETVILFHSRNSRSILLKMGRIQPRTSCLSLLPSICHKLLLHAHDCFWTFRLRQPTTGITRPAHSNHCLRRPPQVVLLLPPHRLQIPATYSLSKLYTTPRLSCFAFQKTHRSMTSASGYTTNLLDRKVSPSRMNLLWRWRSPQAQILHRPRAAAASYRVPYPCLQSTKWNCTLLIHKTTGKRSC